MAAGTGAEVEGQVLTAEQAARRQAAEDRASRIVAHLESAAADIAAAVIDKDWEALGVTRDEWQARLLYGYRRLTPAARKTVHELLAADGMSGREIAAATGTPRSTVQHDLEQGGPKLATPADQPTVTKPLTPGTGPKTGRERVREHRDRRRSASAGGSGRSRTTTPAVTVHGTDCVCAVSEEPRPAKFRDRIRADVKAEVTAELSATCPACAEKDAGGARELAEQVGQAAAALTGDEPVVQAPWSTRVKGRDEFYSLTKEQAVVLAATLEDLARDVEEGETAEASAAWGNCAPYDVPGLFADGTPLPVIAREVVNPFA